MALKIKKSGRSGESNRFTKIASTTQNTLPLRPRERKRKFEEDAEDDKPQVKLDTKRLRILGFRGEFTTRDAKGKEHPIPNYRAHEVEDLVYPVELNRHIFFPSEWAKMKRPANWPDEAVWPPTTYNELTRAYLDETVCVDCGARPRQIDCGCDLSKWQAIQAETWRDNFELQKIPGMGVGVFALNDVDAKVVIGELAGLLRPSNHKASDSAKHYESKLDIGPYQTKVKQPYAYIDVWEYGSWTRFINHSCEANTAFLEARVGRNRLLTVETTQKIKAGTQVTVDYGEGFFEGDDKCRCGTRSCDNPYEEWDSANEEEEEE